MKKSTPVHYFSDDRKRSRSDLFSKSNEMQMEITQMLIKSAKTNHISSWQRTTSSQKKKKMKLRQTENQNKIANLKAYLATSYQLVRSSTTRTTLQAFLARRVQLIRGPFLLIWSPRIPPEAYSRSSLITQLKPNLWISVPHCFPIMVKRIQTKRTMWMEEMTTKETKKK